MKAPEIAAAAALVATFAARSSLAQIPPVGVHDQGALLRSADPQLAANKKLVFDMYRAIIQGGHTELAAQFFTPGYIQHNPNIPSGRDALVKFMSESRPVRPIQPNITFPLVALVAESDWVVVATVSYAVDPQDPSRKYANTHFDMYRIEDHRIAEHWDNLPKDPALLRSDPNLHGQP